MIYEYNIYTNKQHNMYTLVVNDRHYSDVSWLSTTNEVVTYDINPLETKLFHGDTVNNETQDVTSPFKQKMNIPGILILENNRTYGRTENKKKLYYKCRPFSKNYPDFLIPYTIQMGFQKNFKNKYITFRFDQWNQKHPFGVLGHTIGDVHDLPSFYEYMLYCRDLHTPITPFIKCCKTMVQTYYDQSCLEKIIDNDSQRFGTISEWKDDYVFSIDPDGCTDKDDAISIIPTENGYQVNVFIANVWVWLEALDLWEHLGSRMSTIYLPDSKRAMLPSIISETLCSLDEGSVKYAFVMKVFVEKNDNSYCITKTNISQVKVNISKSFVYEEKSLLKNKHYRMLFGLTKNLDNTIQDSHDVVGYWMMKMNIVCAMEMREHSFGIFRSVKSKLKSNSVVTHSESNVQTFLRVWEQQISGLYVNYKTDMDVVHEMVNVKEYTHFTSPIRRIVDLVNQVLWVINREQVNIDCKGKEFVNKIQNNISDLNTIMKNIRKVQSDCSVLHKVYNAPEYTDKVLKCTILNEVEPSKYNVYVPDLQWIACVYSTDSYSSYETIYCKVYLFENEEQMRKKVRLQIVENEFQA